MSNHDDDDDDYYYCFVLFSFSLFNNPISSSICKLPIRSEIYNCTFKNTNKVSIIIIIFIILLVLLFSFIIIFANRLQCRLFLGIELEEFMPSLESLFEAEQLKDAGLSENPQFRYLLKSGYEQINRVATVVSI